ncbi:DUF3822 family protein [Flavobacterium silvaticum]|uniref:DUF3822 family protein n=1 Tax=Flavobacterium silvaticum TaxID=1852020 RepID=A0A972FS00_9FLAO|nr:DUF3822 family protein [Flavobacterium silvaticum]NMH26932.1 DUF3822 family protein [Flavobacterium silvaticum]
MLVNHANITEKNYKKLSLQIAADKVSMCCTNILNQSILWSREVVFPADGSSPESHYHKLFASDTDLSSAYDEIVVLHDNGYNSFVPVALFDENYLGSYLQFSTKVFETDFFAFDELPTYEMNNVFVPFANLNNLLVDQFGTFSYHHTSSTLVSRLLESSKNIDERQVFAHIAPNRFELVVVQNQKLLLYNTFEYRTKEDFIYYVLFTAEQLSLNPEQFRLQLLGDVTEESDVFRIAFKYIRNTELYKTDTISERNGLSEHENRKHFTLFQS